MAKVTGIGGVFIKAKKDQKALLAWYEKHLGIKILDGPQSDENGKFAWLMDPEDNKVELWEPISPKK